MARRCAHPATQGFSLLVTSISLHPAASWVPGVSTEGLLEQLSPAGRGAGEDSSPPGGGQQLTAPLQGNVSENLRKALSQVKR